ncbi:kelch protein 5, partial [Biomphalaria glabrata]
MGSYLESGEFWDIIISVDGKEFKCHRFILAVHSEYFKTCFTTKENDNKKYHSLEGITSEVFELVLKAMYTRCKIVNEDNVFETLKAATYLKISYMENECDILKLVQSQDLETKSEDNVVDAILFWINNRTFENAETDIMPVNQIEARDDGVSTLTDQPALKRRKVDSELNRDILADEEFLVKLFTHVKLSLVSQKCLEKLTEHSLVQGNFNKFIYILCPVGRKVLKLDTFSRKLEIMEELPNSNPISYATHYHDKIIVFYSQPVKDLDMIDTKIYCYDIQGKKWSPIPINESYTPNGMTSFKDELNTYIIQSCGEILKIVDSSTGSIHFEHVRKLWHIDWKLHGAVIVMNELYIYGVTSTDHSASLKVEEGVLGFDKIHYIYKNNNTDNSTFAPFILKNVGDTTL